MNTENVFLINQAETPDTSVSAPMLKNDEHAVTTIIGLENVDDFSNVCRTCATITEFVIPIFDEEGLQNNLAEKIQKHLPIQVSLEDRLPHVVCYQCASTLLAWHELVTCCTQADAALRADLVRRLHEERQRKRQQRQKSKTSENLKVEKEKEVISLEKEQQIKFKEIAEFVVQTLEPSQYANNTSSLVAEPTKTCDYCKTQFFDKDYEDHLITAHLDLLFHCDECDTYVDRKDFLLHMSLHAVQYAENQEDSESLKRKRKKTKDRDKDENANNEVDEINVEDEQTSIEINLTENTATSNICENQTNEFSDHSDAEEGFGPLPESVFTAIEDSQESQTIQVSEARSQTADNESIVCNEESEESSSESLVKSPTPSFVSKSNSGNRKDKKCRTCPICSKVYTAASSYFYHMKHFHRPNKEHECEICGTKFGTKGTLAQHMATHSGECKWECKECPKKFRSRASLYIHQQAHSGAKIWPCGQCHRSFRWRTHLARHTKRHSSKKEHVCSTCGRGFDVRCDLLRHTRTHTVGSIACDKCGLKFAQQRYLKVHIDKKHSIVTNKTCDDPKTS